LGRSARPRPGDLADTATHGSDAANLLINPQLDPMGKILEFKFCAAKVEPAEMAVAAE
jgi:formate dehydrogenase major subunit